MVVTFIGRDFHLICLQIIWVRGKSPADAPPPADRMSRQEAHTRGYFTVSQRRTQLVDDDGRSLISGAFNIDAVRAAAHQANVSAKSVPGASIERARDRPQSLGELVTNIVLQSAASNDFDVFATITRRGQKRLATLFDTYAPHVLLTTFIDANRSFSAAAKSVQSPLDLANARLSLAKSIMRCAYPLLVAADFAKSKPPHVAGVYAVFTLPAAENCVAEFHRIFEHGEGLSLATGEPLELGYRVAIDGLYADSKAFVGDGRGSESVVLAYIGQENRGESCAKGKRLDRVRDHFGRTGEANLREFCFRRSADADSYVVTPIGPVHTASRWLCFLPPRSDDVDMLESAFITLFAHFGIAIANNTPGSGRARRYLHSTWGGGPQLADRLIELQGVTPPEDLHGRNSDAGVSFFLSRPLHVAALMMTSGLCQKRSGGKPPEIIRPSADRTTHSQFQCVEALLSLFATGLGGQKRTVVLWANSCTCGKRGRCACIMFSRTLHLNRFGVPRISWHDSQLSLYLGPRGRGVEQDALTVQPSSSPLLARQVHGAEARVDVELRISARLAAIGTIISSLPVASLGLVDSLLGRVANRAMTDLARADAGGSSSWAASHVGSRLTSGTDVRRAIASRARFVGAPSDPLNLLSAALERQQIPLGLGPAEASVSDASDSAIVRASRLELARVIEIGYAEARRSAAAAIERHADVTRASDAALLAGSGEYGYTA